jgi:nucleotide-binding universal stress UspA family protein
MNTNRIVVGIDGSDGAEAALAWAADEAQRRGDGLLIVYAADVGETDGVSAATRSAAVTHVSHYARRLLSAALVSAELRHPLLDIETTARQGNPAQVLVDLGDSADLLVVGRRGMHNRFDALLGGVSHRVAGHARCPVAVIPHPAKLDARDHQPVIVVGVDRSESAMRALELAFQHAQRCAARLIAVRACEELDDRRGGGGYVSNSTAGWQLASLHLLDYCVSPVAARHPSVPVESRLVRGRPVAALLDTAQEADLLFIGAHDIGHRQLSRLGWTATALLARSPCPVELVGWERTRAAVGTEPATGRLAMPPACPAEWESVPELEV